MESSASAQTSQQHVTNDSSSSQRGSQNRNRRGRDRGQRGGRGSALAFRPASVAPPTGNPNDGPSGQQAPVPSPRARSNDNRQSSIPQATSASTQGGEQRSRRNNGGGRRRGGNSTPAQGSSVPQRQFAGTLTTHQPSPGFQPNLSSQLQPEAPEFTPGQTSIPTGSNKKAPAVHGRRQRKASRSTAVDLATRIHEDIENKTYECAICTSELTRNSKVWSCHTCWTVFHLSCIKQWSSNVNKRENGETQASDPRLWRCPGCNLPQDTKPTSYTCWCGKEHDPKSIVGLPPHSCGQTCGKFRSSPKKCPHPCELPCHAGPCPPCNRMGPKQSCYCGKETSTKKCIETNYETGWSCRKICGDMMPCGEHPCQRECHEGLCGACEVRIGARCYCGKQDKDILCCDRDEDLTSKRNYIDDTGQGISEEWTGMYHCPNKCERPFDCGKHLCKWDCHTLDGPPSHCPGSPDVVNECPCGKTSLDELLKAPRQTCEDPIPNCDKKCLNRLDCGHACQQTCHAGLCPPCLERVNISCRCKRTTVPSLCHQGIEEQPQCIRVCRTTLNCGRHECGDRCCSGERKASERIAAKRKPQPLSAAPRPTNDDFEAEHICTRICGRPLKCGNHICQELCHKGACGSCREAIFDEISCNCGRTTIQPPLPCGTKPPVCRWVCERPKRCGHPQVSHNCHGDDESCPNCPFLTEKVCLCGKKKLKNQQCWFSDVRCGQICGKKLKCGLHYCRKTCHKSGECEAQDKCRQPCGKPKSICGHPCEHECHAPYPCKQDKPCPHKTFITCECQHKKEEVRCAASTSSDGFAASRSLKCDDECARLERNRKLALAFDIDPATHTDDHIPYTAETLKMFAEDTKWAQEQEREFRVFAGNDKEKRLRFKPMPQHQRAFLRALSEDFGLDSESMDPEPHRHVAVFKTPRFVSAPNKTLRDCLRIRNRQQAALASESLPKASAQKPAAASSAPTEPWNGYLLTSVRFALTTDELLSEMTGSAATAYSSPSSSSPLSFTAHFLPSGDVALQASLTPTTGEPSKSASNTTAALDSTLKTLKSPLTRTCNISNLGTLELCRLGYDSSASFSAADSQETHVPVVLARESDFPGAASGGRAGGGGWSQVAAKAAAPRRNVGAPVVAGSKSGFAVLGSNASTSGSGSGTASASKKSVKREKRKERRESTVADDWEVEEEMIMEREEQDKRAVEGVGYAGLVEGEDEGNKASKTMGAEESTAEPASSVPKTESPAGDDWTVNAEDVVGDDAVVATSESLP